MVPALVAQQCCIWHAVKARFALLGNRGFPSPKRIVSSMLPPAPSRSSASAPQPNPVLGSSAPWRLLWALGALVLLWTTVFWAMN